MSPRMATCLPFPVRCELYVLINAVEVFRELVDEVLMDLHESAINISQPYRWGVRGCANGLGFELLHV